MFFNTTEKKAKRLAQFVLQYSKNQASRELCQSLGFPSERFDQFYVSLAMLNSFMGTLAVWNFLRDQDLGQRMNNLILDELESNRTRVLPSDIIKAPDEIAYYNESNAGILPPGIEPYKSSTDSATIVMIIHERRFMEYQRIASPHLAELDQLWVVLAKQFHVHVFGTPASGSTTAIASIYGYLMIVSMELMRVVK